MKLFIKASNPIIYFIGIIIVFFILRIFYRGIRQVDYMLNGKIKKAYNNRNNLSKAKKRITYLFLIVLLIGYLCYDMIYLTSFLKNVLTGEYNSPVNIYDFSILY